MISCPAFPGSHGKPVSIIILTTKNSSRMKGKEYLFLFHQLKKYCELHNIAKMRYSKICNTYEKAYLPEK